MTNNREDELQHFGVKGMKWGVRRNKAISGIRATLAKRSEARKEKKKQSDDFVNALARNKKAGMREKDAIAAAIKTAGIKTRKEIRQEKKAERVKKEELRKTQSPLERYVKPEGLKPRDDFQKALKRIEEKGMSDKDAIDAIMMLTIKDMESSKKKR